MKVVARLVGKDDTDVAGTTLWLDSTVKESGTNLAGTAWVLSVDWTEEVPWQDKNHYSDNYIIHYVAVMPENELADTDKMNITRRKRSEKIGVDSFRTIGQELAASAWWFDL